MSTSGKVNVTSGVWATPGHMAFLVGVPLAWPASAVSARLPPSPALLAHICHVHSSQNLGGPVNAMGGLPGAVNLFDLPSAGWMLNGWAVCILIRAFRVNTSYSGAVPEA